MLVHNVYLLGSWEQTEPILLRYFTVLRKRLQLSDESLYPELQ